MAKNQGWQLPYDMGMALDWEDTISNKGIMIEKNWIEDREIVQPKRFKLVAEIIKYLEILFETDENVSYVVNQKLENPLHE